ncbi:MAG: DUF3196 family protein [Mycoplasma sp.]
MSKETTKQKKKENDELQEYYSELTLKILALYQEKKFEEALAIVEEEISQPYVPNEFLIQFIDLQNDIEKIISNNTFEKEFSDMTKLQIWNKIFDEKNNKVDVSFINLLLEKYNNTLDEIDISIIQKILRNKKIDNIDKSLIIQILCELDNKETFKIYNNVSHKEFNFSQKTFLETTFKQLQEITKELENIFIQDPSRLELSINLLHVLHVKFIPVCIDFPNHDIINTLKNITNSLFGDEVIEGNQITQMLSEFINFEDEK